MSLLRVEGLSKSFGGLKVLSGVSFTMDVGEKLALIGPNGAGKSTLINVIGGQAPASSGKIFFQDKQITSLPPNKRLHLGLARSYQINNLFSPLSVLNNILLFLHGADKSHFHMLGPLAKRKDLLARAEVLLERVGLWERRLELVSTLSYGEQRLLEVLAAFSSEPRLVLLDEPSAGLPTAEASAFAATIRELAGDTTVLFCAHDMDLVFSLADTIMVLYFGQIMAKGLPEEITSNPRVQEIYLGSDATC